MFFGDLWYQLNWNTFTSPYQGQEVFLKLNIEDQMIYILNPFMYLQRSKVFYYLIPL